jgi:conjugal transfer pilus assembly protein TraF
MIKEIMGVMVVMVSFFPNPSFGEEFFNDRNQGWFWYIDPVDENKNTISNKASSTSTLNPTQKMEQLRAKILDSLNLAILHPTEENLKAYAQNYYAIIDQGQYFADAYKLMLMKNPLYDYYLRFPVNHNARSIYNRSQDKKAESAIRTLAKTYGFFFFFAGSCDYCHVFAPTVKRFADKYGITVMPISLDGKVLSEYPNAVPDNGTAKKLGVSRLPALFAVNPKTKQVLPLANGVVSVSELEEIVFKYAEFTKQFGEKAHD